MKKYISIFLLICLPFLSYCQNVGINKDGSVPDPSAMLDVKSTDRGLLLPRMTTVQKNGIITPATGLTVFDTDTKSFWFFNGSAWIESATGSSINYWTLNGSNIFKNNGGNIGIGTNSPEYPLTVQTVSGNFGIAHTDGTITMGTYVGDGYGWFGTKSNHPLTFFTNNSQPQMTLLQSGNFGIGSGITSPVNRLQIGSMGTTGFSGNDIAIGNGTNAIGIAQTNAVTQIASSTNISFLPNANNGSGNVGINILNPTNRLQIGSVGTSGYGNFDLAIGNGTDALAIFQSISATRFNSTTDITLNPQNANGHIGINVTNPTNHLQIGSVGAIGYNGLDLGIGNGTSAFGITQANNGTFIESSTNILLLPNLTNNLGGKGYVGINNFTPQAPLDVYNYNFSGISIIASGRVLATGFDVNSDARIKEIIGYSNSSNDLKILNELKITDYTLKDKEKNGNKSIKKVIAQQVEKVYPEVVSQHKDFIPNVYQLTNKVEKIDNSYLLSFANKHNMSPTAKKLRLFLPNGCMQEMDIISIPSGTKVVVRGKDLEGDKLFVYGEEVNDFRAVDYDGLTTLNISATQELSKLIKKQQKKIDFLQQEIELLGNQIRLSKHPQTKLSSAKQRGNIIKTKKLRS